MKKILLAIGVLFSVFAEAQTYGGQIKAKNNPGVIGDIGRTLDGLKVADSAVLAKLTAGIAVTGTFWQATQPVSGTVAATQSGTWANQLTDGTDVADIYAISSTPVGADKGLVTNSIIYGKSTAGGGAFVEVKVTPSGAAVTSLGDISSVDGQQAMAASFPVVIANDQSAIPVSGTVAISTTTIDVKSTTTPVVTMNSASANSGVNSAMAGVFDDASVTSITENSFGFVRMSANRNQYMTIRDAAGNERGANVNASNEMLVALSSVPTHAVTLTSTTITGSVAVTKSGTWTLDANSGVDIGDVTINNASGASAVNIQDGGNTITVDGAVTVSGTVAISTTTIDTKSTTAPVNTMNSASANSGINAAAAFLFDDVSPTAITENSFGFGRMSANHNQYVVLRDNAGNERGLNIDASGQLAATVTNATAANLKGQVDPLTVATWGLMVEDATETAGANLMGIGTVRRDVPSTSAGSTAENATLNTNSIGALWTSEAATPDQSGYDKYYVVSGASTNAANIKSTPGKVYGWYIFNANASARKVMFHNTSGTPTAGASTFFPLVIPAGSGANVSYPPGINFSSGIGITMVTGTADADATGVASGDLIVTIFYK